ncbi:MAG: UvrD-helicase domain-containing protein [Endomicrobia bacterium]|nr:UvrD-helicase domain-containing protein [Endomicrobiia bacterium]MCL2507059.1 UvrD-helicase domain-containing protein [Endomicrobiia bacterium]
MNKKQYQIISMQASAGSGKTYNLAKRYIHLLLALIGDGNIASLNGIIAVTFANKAAVEMKSRVIDYLKKAALGFDTNHIFDDLKLPEKEISTRSLKALNYILKNYDGFNISTIDSFINHILKSCAINIDISPNFRVEKDISKHLHFALDSFLKNALSSKESENLLLNYLSQYLIAGESGWFPRNDIYGEVENLLKKTGYEGKDINPGLKFFRDGLVSRSSKIYSKVKFFCENYSKAGINGTSFNAIKGVIEKGEKIFSDLAVPATFKNDILKYTKSVDEEKKAGADILWSEVRADVEDLYEFYAGNYYGIYCDIFSKISDEFDIAAKKDELVFLNEMNRKTMKFFRAEESNEFIMPEVYYRLSEKYKHFLIDEFQDTSSLQWSALKRFLEESLAVGGTFFYVGDPKQAIYGFRGGNSEVFYKTEEDLSAFAKISENLSENYRSQKAIVDFNNKVFSKENLERYIIETIGEDADLNNYKTLLTAYSLSFQNYTEEKNKGYVEIETVETENADDSEKVRLKFLEYIRNVSEKFAANDIAVLCRTNDEVSEAGSWLIEEGLNIESNQTLNLKNNGIIKQIVSLLKFIDSPLDSLSFASFVLGEIFQKAPGNNVSGKEIEIFLFRHNKNNKSEVFYKDFRNAYERLWDEYFEEFFVKAGFTPVYELVITLLEKFSIAENFRESEIFILRFLELIKEFEKEDSGIKSFLEYFNTLSDKDEGLYVRNSSGGGIKIMTMHKAKGLQFPVVIIPFLELAGKDIKSPYFDNSGEKINLLYITKGISEFSGKLKSIYDGEKAKSLLAEINSLYVAMTRAEYELYAVIIKCKTKENAAAVLIGNENIKSGSKEKYEIKNKESINNIENTAAAGYKSVQYNIKKEYGDLNANNAMKKGVIIHFALSKILTLKNKDIYDEIGKAVNFVKRKFIYEDTSYVKPELENLFENEKVLKIFNYDDSQIYNEKEIVTAAGDTLRIDKMIETKNDVLIFDFKSSNKTDSNTGQILEYIRHVSEIYPDKNVEGFIVDLDSKNIIKV